MPSAQEYLTVGHLYRSIPAGLAELSDRLREAAQSCGDPALQVEPGLAALKGLCAISDLTSALAHRKLMAPDHRV